MDEEAMGEILGHFAQKLPVGWPVQWTITTQELFCQMVKTANDAGLDCYFTNIANELFRIGIRDIDVARAQQVFVRISPSQNGLQVAYDDDVQHILGNDTINQLKEFLTKNKQDQRKGNWPDQYNSSGEEVMNNEVVPSGFEQIELPLNLILYGPPGTGKTYSVVMEAMSIMDNTKHEDVPDDTYKNLKGKFDAYKKNGKIDFITFHQSYGYEDFVEGIRPITQESGQPTYEVMPGILRRIAKNATDNFKSATTKFQNEFNEELRFDSAYRLLEEEISNSPEAKIEANLFREGIKCDLWVRDQGSFSVQAKDGKQSYPISKKTMFRAWQLRSEIKTPGDIDKTNGTYIWAILKLLEGKLESLNGTPIQNLIQPYILIIDEINRGNISKIFGELITLIESDKRLGEKNEMRVRLPYSPDEEFGLPPNLYFIGTMNTADRSIALLDTALRRRFDFKEMMPKPGKLKNDVDGVNLQTMLNKINERIELLYDRDHTIGHAYLLNVKTLDDLKQVFLHKVIPLLQEYFYEDWRKIMLVLNNNGFIKEDQMENNLFPNFNYNEDIIDQGRKKYSVNADNFTSENFRRIYGNAA